MKIQITYTVSPLAKKGKDFIINPKGYNVKNNFSTKSLIGDVKDSKGISLFLSAYNKLNPKFPIAKWKNLSAQLIPIKQNSNLLVSKPPIGNIDSKVEIAKIISESKISKTNDESETNYLPFIAVGILAFILYKKRKK